MVSPFLYDVLDEAELAHSLVLLDKGVTYTSSSALNVVEGAQLPRDIGKETIQRVRDRFSTWMSLFRAPHIQTVKGVVGEVIREHDFIEHRITELSKAANAAFEEEVISEYDYEINQKYLSSLVQLKDDFSVRPLFTQQNRYLSRDARSHDALLSRVIATSQQYELKRSRRKAHDSDSTTDEELVAAALDYDRHYDSGVAVVTTDRDITKILNKFCETNPVRNQVSVYSLYKKRTFRDVYTPRAHLEDSLVFRRK